jgi:hypothetical protein
MNYFFSDDNVAIGGHVAANRLGSANTSDGNVNDFRGNYKFQLRIEISHFERGNERQAATSAGVATRRRLAKAMRTKNNVGNSLRIDVSLDVERTHGTPLNVK